MNIQQIYDELIQAIDFMVNTSRRNSTKGKLVTKWFKDKFGLYGISSLILDNRQTGNRILEQFKHKATHIIFLYDPSISPETIIKRIKEHRYAELESVLLLKYSEGTPYLPTHLVYTTSSGVIKFYREKFSAAQEVLLETAAPNTDVHPEKTKSEETTAETVIECDVLSVEAYTVEQLGKILTDMYESAESKTSAIHLFGIKYGEVIKANGYSATAIVGASNLNESYHVEVGKGIRLYETIKKNEFGVRFFEAEEMGQMKLSIVKTLPILSPRKRTRFSLNNILYGAPGTGKTFSTAQYALAIVENKSLDMLAAEKREEIMTRYNALISSGQIAFTTFHQNYGYEDFIQGIRPDTATRAMAFKTVDGVFKVIADKAMQHPEQDYVIIIDEINRANISKVFGELITLIEDDKRWGELNAITVTLPSGDIFAVPNNLYILGTMNSADKSISLIDTALRRRFDFVEYAPKAELIADEDLRKILVRLNEGLSAELGSTDLLIGHSYFMNKSIDDLCDIMNRNIIPLLYEYFFDNQKKVEVQIKTATEDYPVEVISGNVGRIRLAKKDVSNA